MEESAMASRSEKTTLQRAQEEIQDLLMDLQAGTLDRITLEAGLKKLQERLKAIGIHQHHLGEHESDDNPGTGKGPNPK
jgi:hypothetical protein